MGSAVPPEFFLLLFFWGWRVGQGVYYMTSAKLPFLLSQVVDITSESLKQLRGEKKKKKFDVFRP